MFARYEGHRMYTGVDTRKLPFLKCSCGDEIRQGRTTNESGTPMNNQRSSEELIGEHIKNVITEDIEIPDEESDPGWLHREAARVLERLSAVPGYARASK